MTGSNPVSSNSLDETAAAIEAYFDVLRVAGFELFDEVIPRHSRIEIANTEQALSMALPADVKELLTRGLRAASGAIAKGARFAGIGFDWLDAKKIVSTTKMLRKAVADTPSDDEHARILRAGIVLTWSEPQIVVADAVYHFSFRNPVVRVTDSLSEFLSAWLAAGCFSDHDFDLLWRTVESVVPVKIPPSENPWLEAYQRQFPHSQEISV